MRWARHVACVGEGRGVYRVSVGRPNGKDHWENQDEHGNEPSDSMKKAGYCLKS
jgi:hypothetical protein